MNKYKVRVAAAAIAGIAAASAMPLQSAVAASSPPTPYYNYAIQSPATLVARGAALDVPVQVTCFGGAQAFQVSLQVTQRINGGRVASGYGFVQTPACDGFPHVVTARVTANQNAFKAGQAFASSDGYICSPLGCASVHDEAQIDIKK